MERLQENLEIWHEAGYAVHLAPKLGVREVRRIKGEYVLTANDLIAGTMHDDVIAHAHYSFDVWGMKIPEEMKHIGLMASPIAVFCQPRPRVAHCRTYYQCDTHSSQFS